MSTSAETAGLKFLTEGLVRLQQKLLTRDPWLPKSGEALREELRRASESGALTVISTASGALGLLRSDHDLLRLLGPLVREGPDWERKARSLLSQLENAPAVRGRMVKTAINADDEPRWRVLESGGFRRYNAELTLTIARGEWSPSPGRSAYRSFPGIPGERGARRGVGHGVRRGGGVRIRPYRSEDADALFRLHPEAAYFSAQTILSRSEAGEGMIFVAAEERGGQSRALGYLYLETGGGSGEICFVNVEEAARGAGLGTRLITTALDYLFSLEGVESVDISVRPDNPAADLYRRIGFSPVVTYYSYERRFY